MNEMQKPVIGFTSGDLNGIGVELIIKSLSDSRIIDFCTPVIFGSNKTINFYRKMLPDANFSFQSVKDLGRLNIKQVNVYNCWDEEVQIQPGQLSENGGKYALLSLRMATQALKDGKLDAIVTAPIHKKNIQSEAFNYSGHTPFFKDVFKMEEVVMLMVAENMRVAVLTEHIPVSEIASKITKEAILSKLRVITSSLQTDFGIEKPTIAVLGLNPHAGDEGLIGNEEQEVIIPAIREAKQKNILAFGPFSADAFFAHHSYEKFDAVLAMYHDQGLIPFKSLEIGEGVNYTAGLPVVRTSPDHGTAFDIAGKGIASVNSFLRSIFLAIDVLKKRAIYREIHANPLKKMSSIIVANAQDEIIREDNGG